MEEWLGPETAVTFPPVQQASSSATDLQTGEMRKLGLHWLQKIGQTKHLTILQTTARCVVSSMCGQNM